MTHGLREASNTYQPAGSQNGWGRSIANHDILRALKTILESVEEVGFGKMEGTTPCTMGLLCNPEYVDKTNLPGGSYFNDYFTIIPMVNDKFGPQEDNRARRNRMLAWVKNRLQEEARRGYRHDLSDKEIQELTIMPLRNMPYFSFGFNYNG